MTGFDPSSLAATAEPPQKTTPKKKAKAKTVKQSNSPQSEMQRQALSIAAAYELLDALEQRHEVLTAGDFCLAESEWLVLLSAQILERRSVHELARLLSSQRDQQKMRAVVAELGDREKYVSAVETLENEEQEFNVTIGEIGDISGASPLAEKVKELKEQGVRLHSDRREAERNLSRIDNAITTLKNAAPKPIHRIVENTKQLIQLSEDGRQLSQLSVEADSLERLLDVNSSKSPLRNIGHAFTDGHLHSLISRYCDPSIIQMGEGGRRFLDQEKFSLRMHELRASHLPKLQAERDRLRPIIEEAIYEAEAPLRDWVATGILPVELLY